MYKAEQKMTFFDHLDVLRKHILRSLVVVSIFTFIVFSFKNVIFGKILFAPLHADFFTLHVLCQVFSVFCDLHYTFETINLKLSGQFMTHIKGSFLIGFVISTPYIFFEMWQFISPALYKQEKNTLAILSISSALLFILGALFGYFVLSPVSINFLANYTLGIDSPVVNKFDLTDYFSYLSMSVLASSCMFELPLVIYFLSVLGLVGPDDLRGYRRYAVLIILVVAAIITPADPASQILVALPVYILYECSILIALIVYRRQSGA